MHHRLPHAGSSIPDASIRHRCGGRSEDAAARATLASACPGTGASTGTGTGTSTSTSAGSVTSSRFIGQAEVVGRHHAVPRVEQLLDAHHKR